MSNSDGAGMSGYSKREGKRKVAFSEPDKSNAEEEGNYMNSNVADTSSRGQRSRHQPSQTPGPSATSSSAAPFAPEPLFEDWLHAEASFELRTPLGPLQDEYGNLAADNIQEVIQDPKKYIRWLLEVFKNDTPDVFKVARRELEDSFQQNLWDSFQTKHREEYDEHMQNPDLQQRNILEKRLWEILKEVVAVHRVGYMQDLPGENWTCINRIFRIRCLINDFMDIRTGLLNVATCSVDIPFLVAAPHAVFGTRFTSFMAKAMAWWDEDNEQTIDRTQAPEGPAEGEAGPSQIDTGGMPEQEEDVDEDDERAPAPGQIDTGESLEDEGGNEVNEDDEMASGSSQIDNEESLQEDQNEEDEETAPFETSVPQAEALSKSQRKRRRQKAKKGERRTQQAAARGRSNDDAVGTDAPITNAAASTSQSKKERQEEKQRKQALNPQQEAEKKVRKAAKKERQRQAKAAHARAVQM